MRNKNYPYGNNSKNHPTSPTHISREEELTLINQALSTPKYRRFSSEEYFNHFFNNLNKASLDAKIRIKKTNRTKLGKRIKSNFKEII